MNTLSVPTAIYICCSSFFLQMFLLWVALDQSVCWMNAMNVNVRPNEKRDPTAKLEALCWIKGKMTLIVFSVLICVRLGLSAWQRWRHHQQQLFHNRGSDDESETQPLSLTHTCIGTYTHTYTYTHIQNMHISTHAHTYTWLATCRFVCVCVLWGRGVHGWCILHSVDACVDLWNELSL